MAQASNEAHTHSQAAALETSGEDQKFHFSSPKDNEAGPGGGVAAYARPGVGGTG